MWIQNSAKHTQAKARSVQLSILILKCISFIFVYHRVMTINQAWNWQSVRRRLVRGIQRRDAHSFAPVCWLEWCMSSLTSQEKVCQSKCSGPPVPISHLRSSMMLADTRDSGNKRDSSCCCAFQEYTRTAVINVSLSVFNLISGLQLAWE